ncbi:hypothetical protein K505DRAFT_321589 [Melanomma pulvis-pyrius CBS 109.77]|uniref:Uncharacterized protein n=1 Tax=Melanomma pulvis-pyrius CBS 109.77 TaxID=1314802 RepID=A0A6A6XT06_9PLEO|nr:hypothetical protein K505DRAFT_321589 [Melanomma pulvis-pyrius CBS 109.77]
MPSLLSLPREIRDKICTYAILAPRNEPAPLTTSIPDLLLERRHLEHPRLSAWGNLSTVKYRPDNIVASSTPLLLVNHQLYAETISNLRLIPGARTYDLDIIVLDEILLVPTWLLVPVLDVHVDRLNVTFRIAGRYNHQDRYQEYGRYKGFAIGDGAGPALSWHIYSLLERFFKVGPIGECNEETKDRNVTIKTLEINIETPSDVAPSRFMPPKSGHRRRKSEDDEPDDAVLDPEYFIDFVTRNVRWMLKMDYHSANYGKIFYEYMDRIIVRRDGEVELECDLAERFRDLKFTDSFWRNQIQFDRWKEQATKKRRAWGLRVLEEEKKEMVENEEE